MKIHLEDSELKNAIKYHLSTQENIDLNPELYDVEIQLTAGRGDKGHYADIVRTKRTDDSPFVDGENTDSAPVPGEDEPGINFDD